MSFENCGGVCRLVWHIPGVYLLQQAKFYLLISIISSFEFMYSPQNESKFEDQKKLKPCNIL